MELDKGNTSEHITSQESIENKQTEANIQSPNDSQEGIQQEDSIEMEEDDSGKNNVNEDGGVEEEEEQEGLFLDDEDDDEGWITPSNVSKVKKEMGFQETEGSTVDTKSACLTTDFAMQVFQIWFLHFFWIYKASWLVSNSYESRLQA